MKPIENMVARGHERVCIHYDRESGLRAIIAVHSTVLGNALGGTRRWHYAHEEDALEDVLRLSQGMTYKAACAGLAMGGAKSVILLYLQGGPSHLDLWDPKDNLPDNVKSVFKRGKIV